MHRTCFGYVRVSTTRQSQEGCSLAAQAERIRAWAASHGHPLGAMFEDAGISGATTDARPGLQQALDAVCATGGVLVVYSLSRLARSTRDAIDIATRLERAGADLVSLSEAIDTTTATGKFMFRLLAAVAELERDLIAERTAASLAHLKAQGRRVSGRVPFGFDLQADGTLVVNEAEMLVVEALQERRAAGMSWNALAAWLTAEGVPAKAGGRWRGDAVKAIVQRIERDEQEIA